MHITFSARIFLVLLLVLGSLFGLVASDDDEETEDEAVTESKTEAETQEPVHEVNAQEKAALEECAFPSNSTKEKCCKNNWDIDDAVVKCFVLHQKKMPKKTETNPNVLIKFFSCLIECIYKSKKYIGKGDTLNMKMIKSEANKLHKGDERLKQHMIEMYEHCERHAGDEWRGLKKNPAAKVVLAGACKPYYMFVFICVVDYGKISCPHFKWKGTKENASVCEDLKHKCEELQP